MALSVQLLPADDKAKTPPPDLAVGFYQTQ